MQPQDALAANNLAYIMIEHKESVNVALTLAQTARRGLPNLPNSADTLGWAYYHSGAYLVAGPSAKILSRKTRGIRLIATTSVSLIKGSTIWQGRAQSSRKLLASTRNRCLPTRRPGC
jgi:hypothetical protein